MSINEWLLCVGVFIAFWFLSSIVIQAVKLFFLWIKYKLQTFKEILK